MEVVHKDHFKLMNALLQCTEAAIAMELSDDDDIILELLDLCEAGINIPLKKKNRLWLHPNRQRNNKELIEIIKNELISNNPTSNEKTLKISRENFELILNIVKVDFEKSDTHMRTAITPDKKLAVTLTYLATGETIVNLDKKSGLSTSLISNLVPIVCDSIYKRLKENYLNMRISTARWKQIANEYANKWQFPNCIGALDVKPINFRKRPPHTNSIQLVALVDANYRFIYAKVDCTEYLNDADVFLLSSLKKIMDVGTGVPKKTIIGTDRKLPHVILTNDIFPMQNYLMKPFAQITTNEQEKIYNQRFYRAKQVVNRAFAMLTHRFKIFQTQINLKTETIEKIILACCVLHNFLIENEPRYLYDVESIPLEHNVLSFPTDADDLNSIKESEIIRHQFMLYFNKEGKL